MHKVIVTKTNNKTGNVGEDIRCFYSIYNAKRYITEIELMIEDLRLDLIEKNKVRKRHKMQPLEKEIDIDVELIENEV